MAETKGQDYKRLTLKQGRRNIYLTDAFHGVGNFKIIV
jgi:hypothetical protein